MPENAKGALFKNDKKQGSQPDWTGNIELNVEFLTAVLAEAKQTGVYKARLAAWVKSGNKGTFLSLSLNAPFDKNGKPTGSAGPRTLSDDPF